MKWRASGMVDFEIGNMFTKKVKATGTSAHVIIPKQFIGKTVLVVIPARDSIRMTLTQENPYGISPDLMCRKCGRPLCKPANMPKVRICKCKDG